MNIKYGVVLTRSLVLMSSFIAPHNSLVGATMPCLLWFQTMIYTLPRTLQRRMWRQRDIARRTVHTFLTWLIRYVKPHQISVADRLLIFYLEISLGTISDTKLKLVIALNNYCASITCAISCVLVANKYYLYIFARNLWMCFLDNHPWTKRHYNTK